MGPRAHLRAARRCQRAAARRPVERRVQAGRCRGRSAPRRRQPPRRSTHRRSGGTHRRVAALRTGAAARLERDLRLDLAAERRAQRRSRLRLGREAHVPVPASDLDDPLPRVQRPVAARSRADQARRRTAGRPARRPLGTGRAWSPLAATPPSPGWASGDSAFASAADEVLTTFTGHSFAGPAALAAAQGLDRGTELPGDVAAGRALGTKIGRLVSRKLAPDEYSRRRLAPEAPDPDGRHRHRCAAHPARRDHLRERIRDRRHLLRDRRIRVDRQVPRSARATRAQQVAGYRPERACRRTAIVSSVTAARSTRPVMM